MKISSISLIAATLATIACNAITAPGPLHARASEDVNLLERDLLYRRLFSAPMGQEHRVQHHETARLCLDGIQAHQRTIDAARRAAHAFKTVHPVNLQLAQDWKDIAKAHRTFAKRQGKTYALHAEAAENPDSTHLLAKVPKHKREARRLENLAIENIKNAELAIKYHKLEADSSRLPSPPPSPPPLSRRRTI